MGTNLSTLDWCVEQIRNHAQRITTLERRLAQGETGGGAAPASGGGPQPGPQPFGGGQAYGGAQSFGAQAFGPPSGDGPTADEAAAASAAVSMDGVKALTVLKALELDFLKPIPSGYDGNPDEFRAFRTADLVQRMTNAGPGIKNLAVVVMSLGRELAQRETAPAPITGPTTGFQAVPLDPSPAPPRPASAPSPAPPPLTPDAGGAP